MKSAMAYWSLLFGVLLSLWTPSAIWAEAGPAATRVEAADEDFVLMGEFAGRLSSPDESTAQAAGLQVVALGEGKFQAALFAGGLPGNGSDGHLRKTLTGQRDGDRLLLAGEDLQIEVRGVQATVSASGKSLGVLSKVRRRSVYENAPAPAYSIVLFDGQDARAFRQPRVENGLLQVGTELVPTYRNFQMHIEFMTPYMPAARSQGRGNSGVYIHSRYEVQVLDSFGLERAFNECGSLYRQRSPDINMAFPPLTWQTYDITFYAPKFDAWGNKCQNGRITVLHNGVKIHDNVEIQSKTGAGQAEGPESLPIKLQDHDNPVQYRNIWLIELPFTAAR